MQRKLLLLVHSSSWFELCVLKWVILFQNIFSLQFFSSLLQYNNNNNEWHKFVLLTSKYCHGRCKIFITLSLNGYVSQVPNIRWIVANEIILNDDENFSMRNWPMKVLCLKSPMVWYCNIVFPQTHCRCGLYFEPSVPVYQLQFSYQTCCTFNVQFV